MSDHFQEAVAAFQRGDLERARGQAEEARALDSDAAAPLHLIGLIECRQGKLESGIEWLGRAVAADPDNPGFRIMLVRALVDCGRADDALVEAIRPAGATPPELGLWHARAEAAQAAGDWNSATEAWGAVASARPADWRAWSNKGDALAKCEQWSEAAVALRRAADLNPGEARIRRNLASALGRSGAHRDSMSEFERLILDTPDDAQLHVGLARSLAALGLHPEAMLAFDRAAGLATAGVGATDGAALVRAALGERGDGAQLSDDDRDAMRELAMLLERSNRLEALQSFLDEAQRLGMAPEEMGFAAVEATLRSGRPDAAKRLLGAMPIDDDPVHWHRMMSRIAAALDDHAAAFSEAEAMNRATPDYEQWRSRGREYRQQARAIAQEVVGWSGDPPALAPGPHRAPAFLVGFPRSGTTLLDTFLMGHGDVRVMEEVPLLAAAEQLVDMADLPRCSPERLAAARDAYFAALDHHDPGISGLVVNKMPLDMMRLPLIFSLFPDAKVIFAQRHPCDCVLSGFMQHFALNPAMACFLDLGDAADLYDAAMTLFEIGQSRAPESVRTVVYEDLVADPEGVLRPLVDWLGLEWQAGLLDHRRTAARRGTIGTPSYQQVTEPLSKRSSGRWESYKERMAPVLPLLGPWAERLGYGAARLVKNPN